MPWQPNFIMIDLLKPYEKTVKNSPLFEGLSDEAYPHLMKCMQGSVSNVGRGTAIATAGGESYMAGMLLKGEIEEFLVDENGNQISLRRLRPGDVFGAELAFDGQRTCPYYLRTTAACDLLLLNFAKVQAGAGETRVCPYRMQVITNLAHIFAKEMAQSAIRMQILSQKKLRDKLRVYLQNQDRTSDGCIHLLLNRREMADYLYVDRSALSRELGRMRDEGILAFDKNSFHVLQPEFLAG